MAWQVRHRVVGLFMGVSHGKGHYSTASECCRSMGVFRFTRQSQIEAFFEVANSPHLPDDARLVREDFVIEEWSLKDHDLLLDEGLLDDIAVYLHWSTESYPIGMN